MAAGRVSRRPGRSVAAVLYECTITHARKAPLHHVFSYRGYLWLVDLASLPPGFRGRDHLGDPRRGIRENLDEFLRIRGISLDGGRVMMLANPRVLGHVFNPLTVYWCHRPDDTLACVVAEVHNTYGQRHAYLLHTDDRGRARAPKEFYVSPFFPVDGEYRMSLPEPDSRLALSVVLGHRFAAGVHGRGVPESAFARLRASWPAAAVPARIRWQGIRLYARGLRPVPRPAHSGQEGVQ